MNFMNTALIQWLSRKQPTIETSVFEAKFVAMKNWMETLCGLRYKLQMMGVLISGPSFIYGDSRSVVHNTQRPESTLKKKSMLKPQMIPIIRESRYQGFQDTNRWTKQPESHNFLIWYTRYIGNKLYKGTPYYYQELSLAQPNMTTTQI